MKDNYDDLNDTFNTDSAIEVSNTPEGGCVRRKDEIRNVTGDIDKDYQYTRANLYSLIEKGQESLNGIMELAGESASPRAYEVAGQIIKSVADTTDKLMELQKKVKEVDEEKIKTTNNVTNNAVFAGSTTELQKMLKDGILNNKEDNT
jgi:tetrahydrodipicolinate N-succinyltransferase